MKVTNLIAQQLKRQGKLMLKADGVSMFPVLRPKDLIFYRRISFGRCQVNDLLMVKKGKKLFTHRVIYKSQKYLVTKGDNSLTSDGKIYPKQIIGKVCQMKRDGQIFNPEDIYLIQSSQYFQEIIKIKKAFERARIDFVFLKGLPLHLYFEKTHPRRIYADCDILANQKDYFQIEKVLTAHGFKKTDTAYSPIHKMLKDKETEAVFLKKIGNFPVVFDVHFEPVFLMNQLGRLEALYPQKLIDKMTENFLRTKKKVNIKGYKFSILNSEFLILYLALHFFHHNFKGIFRLDLLDKVIRSSTNLFTVGGARVRRSHPRGDFKASSPPEVFSRLSNKILEYRLQNFVYPVFLLLKKYYDLPIPKSFIESIKPNNSKLKYINRNVLKRNIFNDEPRIGAGVARFKNIFYLSREPLVKKILVFLTPSVIYSFLWVIYTKLTVGLRQNFSRLI